MAAKLGARLGTLNRHNTTITNGASKLRLQLTLSADNLIELNVKRADSPNYFCIVETREESQGDDHAEQWTKVGKTEVVYNTGNPQWPTTFTLNYSFNVVQKLRFTILRFNANDKTTQKLGQMKCTVAHLIMADGHMTKEIIEPISNNRLSARRSLRGSRNLAPIRRPVLNIQTEEERGDIGDSVSMQFALKEAACKRPFYMISREDVNASGKYAPVLFSEVLRSYKKFHTTAFNPLTVPLVKLNNNTMDRKLRLELCDYNRNGAHRSIACFDFTLSKLLSLKKEGNTIELSPSVNLRNSFFRRNPPVIQLLNIELSTSYSFIDYIRAGVEFNLMVAIDMSSSNGNPRDRNSLQSNNRDIPNDYVVALRQVGFVLEQYDTDSRIPAYGFASVLPPEYAYLSFCFALSGDSNNPACNGIEDVVKKYYDALDVVAPHQPCYVNPVIQHCVEECKDLDTKSYHTTYTVLLLITDGNYQDQGRIADTLFEACDLPLSLVVVGVGKDESNFKLLEELDGDENRLCNSQGVPCARDIVQFVPFEKHRHSPAELSAETLAEVPTQLLEYMRSQGLRPEDIRQIREKLANDETPTPGDVGAKYEIANSLTSHDSEFSELTSASSSIDEGPVGQTSTPPPDDLHMMKPPSEDRPSNDNFSASTYKMKGNDFGIYVQEEGTLDDAKSVPRSPTVSPVEKSWASSSSQKFTPQASNNHNR